MKKSLLTPLVIGIYGAVIFVILWLASSIALGMAGMTLVGLSASILLGILILLSVTMGIWIHAMDSKPVARPHRHQHGR